MSAIVTAVLVQSAIPAAPPPSPPSVFVAPRSMMASPRGRERFLVDVEVRAGGDVLWSGPMTVSTGQVTSFMRRLSEPGPDDCSPGGYVPSLENSLSVQISSQGRSNGDAAFAVSVRWGRSVPGACPDRAGNRSVELSQTVSLEPGRTVTVSGDADLTVRLRRR